MDPALYSGRFQQISSKNVLVIDSDVVFGQAFKSALERVHFSVNLQQDADSALQLLHHHNYDLIILDSFWDPTSVEELVASIRNRCSAPIIVYATAGIGEIANKCRKAGAAAYLVKNSKDIPSLLVKIIALTSTQVEHRV
ncbi:response regulator receiver domain-containing protein [Chitinophaga dinghuensis]|uniref:Response regulator receiver domain-containing protein n=1 Tax=Chitinophaga dinghuensis TaxID=1539050 RepID=A0A327W4M7_9BACT|nr:response regulator [Chitinophaga dinghuensis]RAJ79918.1 response regulator receiver domain-containing protein [Chitinophaga dinghuensis]